MRDFTEDNLTDAVIAQIDAVDPRTQQVITSLVRHLHDFVRDVEPDEREWMRAIEFLTATGQKCDEKRQEFILLSDTLGVSMLVDAINHRTGGTATTETTVLGPFHITAPELDNGTSIARGPEAARGEPCLVTAQLTDPHGNIVTDASVDVWQAADDGFYDIQPESGQPEVNLRGVFHPDADGTVWFRTIVPLHYPIPTDGPVGELLRATGRHSMRPAHVHFWIGAPGFVDLVTHIFIAGDPYLDSDAVFGVKQALIVELEENTSAADAQRYGLSSPFKHLHYDFVLTPEPS